MAAATTFLLVHGAWHGSWAWERVAPLLRAAGTHVVAPDLTHDRDVGLHTHVDEVLAALDAVPDGHTVVLAGHSYAGLVVRQAADRRPERIARVVLVDGWAGPDGASMLSLAPAWFAGAVRESCRQRGDGWRIPAPPPAAFGITEPGHARWLEARLRPQPLRTFTEATRLDATVDRIPGTAICCRPAGFPFATFAEALGYDLVAVDGPHDVMLTDPRTVARELVAAARRRSPA